MVEDCTGLSASKLGGVGDWAFFPVKSLDCCVTETTQEATLRHPVAMTDGKKVLTFTTRAASGCTVLGGSIQKRHWALRSDTTEPKNEDHG